MKNPSRKEMIAWVSILIVIIFAVIVATIRNSMTHDQNPPSKETISSIEEISLSGITIPEPGDEPSKAHSLAIPRISEPAAPGVDNRIRAFDIHLDQEEISAKAIAVKEGDTVHIVLRAIDRDYTMSIDSYNVTQTIPKGSEKIIQFQAAVTGVFDYSCDSCKTKGQLFVKKRE